MQMQVSNCAVQMPARLGDAWMEKICTGTDLCSPKDANETAWLALEPPPYARRSSNFKLAVLMLAMDRIENKGVWKTWMNRAMREGFAFRLIIHPKSTGVFADPEFKPYLVEESAGTSWAQSVDAELVLIRAALQDKDVTHMVMISSDTVPVKPIQYMYAELQASDYSRFCMDWDTHWMYVREKGRPRAESWWMLRREDAELLERNSAQFVSTFRKGNCDGENTWMYPLALLSYSWGATRLPLRDECVTLSDWSGSCKGWAANVLAKDFPNLSKEANIPANIGHPRQYTHVGPGALREMVLSHFWFGRKFAQGSFSSFAWDEELLQVGDGSVKMTAIEAPSRNFSFTGFLRAATALPPHSVKPSAWVELH